MHTCMHVWETSVETMKQSDHVRETIAHAALSRVENDRIRVCVCARARVCRERTKTPCIAGDYMFAVSYFLFRLPMQKI